ncbi:MAG: glycosyltransferase family 39 protein, partial [Candidatus Ornithomonoglobus sp.]
MDRLKVNDEKKTLAGIFIAAVLSRLLILAVSVMALRLSGNSKSLYEIFSTPGDVPHYLYLAEHWYQSAGEKANLIVFFPLMPMLIAVFRVILRSYLISGLVISYLSFGIASCYFYKLLRIDYDEERSYDGLLAMFMAVFGVFFLSAHTESLFIMLVAMVLYYMRKKNWILSGAIGFFAALTKTQGMLLFIPVVYCIVVDTIRNRSFDKKALSALLILLGYFGYLLINKIYGGSFFKFVEYQAAAPWYNSSTWR